MKISSINASFVRFFIFYKAFPIRARAAFTSAALLISFCLATVSPFIEAEAQMLIRPSESDESLNRAFPAVFEKDFVDDELLVSFRPGTARSRINEVRESFGAAPIKEFPEIRVHHWRLGRGSDVLQRVEALSRNPNVEFAEPNYIVTLTDFPTPFDDKFRGELWGMHNLGQDGGTADADIDAPEAWAYTTGSQDVVIGVIDTGIDYNHPDLQGNIWTNPGEIAGNGIDDDGNGFVDDVRGWDFGDDDNDPMDTNGHGTHVAGTIGARGNNGIGVVGVNWNVRLMPIKIIASTGVGNSSDTIDGILYASRFKDSSGNNLVRITNNSWSTSKSKALQNAIASSGALFVASAGNDGSSAMIFPAGYNNANILSVAATDRIDGLATFSNFGSTWVDLGAPGVNVVSTHLGNGYRGMSGTSMAAPHVVGVAGLILAENPGLSITDLKARIMNNVDPLPSLAGKTVTGGRLNARKAVSSPFVLSDGCLSASCAPAAVTDLTVDPSSITGISMRLQWTSSGDDGTLGNSYLNDIRFSTAPIDSSNFANASLVFGEAAPAPPGSSDNFLVNGLSPNTTYYFAIRVADEVGNLSGIAVTSGTTLAVPWFVSVVEDTTGDIGFYSSLAYDKSGSVPALGYSADGSVKFAKWEGTGWSRQVVDTDSSSGISIAFSNTNDASMTYGGGKLRFAQFVPSSQTWQITNIETKNAVNDVTSHVYAPNGDASVSYRVSTVKGPALKFARRTSSGWSKQTVATAGARYSSLAYDASGNPSIAFSDDVNGDGFLDTLKFARWNGSSWQIQTVETGVVGYGVFASLVYDSAGNPAIVHVDGGAVRFVRWNGSSWNAAEIVANGSRPSMVFDSTNGSFYVSLSDGNALFVATRAAGVWTVELADAGFTTRFKTSVAISPCGSPSVGYSTSPNNDLRFATMCPP